MPSHPSTKTIDFPSTNVSTVMPFTPETNSDKLPTFEALLAARQSVKLTVDARRLYWTLTGGLETAIQVMPNVDFEPDAPLQAYIAPDGTPAPISQAPLTEPRVSAVNVHVQQLDDWEDTWLDYHRDHGEPGPHNEGDEEDILFGKMDDYDSDSDEEEDPEHGRYLLRYCGADRPRKKNVSLMVSGTGGKEGYVTVHDYVAHVHPWLMGLKGSILVAGGNLLDNVPLDESTILKVVWLGPESLDMVPEEEWMRRKHRQSGVSSVGVRLDGSLESESVQD